jgi:hypothetical protein
VKLSSEKPRSFSGKKPFGKKPTQRTSGSRPSSSGSTRSSAGRPGRPERKEGVRPGSDQDGRSKRPPSKSRATDRPIRVRRIEPDLPTDVEAKMLPGKVRAELLSLSAENSEVVAKQMVMIDRLLASGIPADQELAREFGNAASNRAGRVGMVRTYAGKSSLAVKNYPEAKKHLSAAIRISGNDFNKVLLAEAETGIGKPRKALDILGEIDSGKLSSKELLYAHLISAEAREALGQPEAALVTLAPHVERVFEKGSDDPELLRWRSRWDELKTRLTSAP